MNFAMSSRSNFGPLAFPIIGSLCLVLLLSSITMGKEQIFTFTNIVCKSFNSTAYDFKKCELKLVRRGVSALNIFVKVNSTPIYNITANISLFKKSNGYKPFLFNQTVDFCYYMRNPKSYNVFYSLHEIFMSQSNMNHTCPYGHDIIVNRLILNDRYLMMLPVPSGSYLFIIKTFVSDAQNIEVKVYITKAAHE